MTNDNQAAVHALKITVNRQRWQIFEVEASTWVTVVSSDSRLTVEFWLKGGTWAGREIWDFLTDSWRISCVRKYSERKLVMERV